MQKKTIELNQKILYQSFLLFLKKGYEETTTREIAAACDIERGVLHYHFRRKQDILFELYRQFFSLLHDSIIDQFPEESDAVVIIICDTLLYRILLTRAQLSRMMVSVMRNRDLTKMKIVETSSVLYNKDLPVSYSKMQFALSIAIGAEVELILQLTAGEIDLSLDELAKWVSGLVLTSLGYSSSDVDIHYSQALKCVELFDEKAFAEKMEQNAIWFHKNDIQ